MPETILMFPSLEELLDFKAVTVSTAFEINTNNKSLRGAFSHSDIEMALQFFHATVIDHNINSEVHDAGSKLY